MAPRLISSPRAVLGRVALSAAILLAPLAPGMAAPPPEPEPGTNNDAWLGGALLGSGLLISGLSVWLLASTYGRADPADDPDPGLTEEEQWREENRYNAGIAYGWGFGVAGLGVAVLGGFLLASALGEDESASGLSTGIDGVRWTPMVGPTVGGGLSVEF